MERQNVNNELLPDSITSPLYIAGYLNMHIGKLVRVEFLIGNSITDRMGILLKVGVSYIIIHPIDVNGTLLCDLYSIKFVTIVEGPISHMLGGFVGI